MQNDKSNFKDEFKRRLYNFVLKLIEFLDGLPKDNVSLRIGDQLLRSGTSVMGNYTEGQAASSRKDFTNYFNNSLKSSNERQALVCTSARQRTCQGRGCGVVS